MEDLSPFLHREVVFYPENSSQIDRNLNAETGFSMDAEIESEDAPNHILGEKSICDSLQIKNKLVSICLDLESG